MIIFAAIFFVQSTKAQFIDKLSKKIQKATEKSIEKKLEQKATKTTNEGMDEVLNAKKTSSKKETSSKKNQNKTDFVAGTTILWEEKFSKDAEGDFPVDWFTNSSGEIVTFGNDRKKWLQISDKGSFCPLGINNLPENFTFEFDVTTSDAFSNYSTPLNIVFTEKTTKVDNVWNTVYKRKEAVIFNIHPSNSLSGFGRSEVFIIDNKKEILKNKVDAPNFSNANNSVRVQVWRQKDRFRMYVDGKKVWDLPTAFGAAKYNQIIFFIGTYKKPVDKFFISNLKLAKSTTDSRHQLLETGSFVTNEILFDTNKASIKTSSKKVLDELGNLLAENMETKVSITGHTDSDGYEKDNQILSEKRAAAVAEYFYTNFSISKNRIKTFGKGASEPITKNNNEEAKKQNRRVAFVLL